MHTYSGNSNMVIMYIYIRAIILYVYRTQLKFYQEMLGDWRFQRVVQPVSETVSAVAKDGRTEQEAVDEKNILSTKRRREGVDYVQLQLEVFSITCFRYLYLCVFKVYI